MMMMINNDIWSKFDEVMERELSGKDRVSFYKLPSHIRVMIWNMKNREEKIENLKKDNKYNKSLLMYEFTTMIEEHYGYIGNPFLDERGGLKLSGEIVCPRLGQRMYDDFDGTWWNYDITACSTSWFEERSKECKMEKLEEMKEGYDEFEEMNIGF